MNVQQKMKEALIQKFGKFAIGQSAWLHTRRTTDIDQLTVSELESLYTSFFPAEQEKKSVQNDLLTEKKLKNLRSVVLKDAQYIGLYDVQDWSSFNKFMLENSPLKKALNKYAEDEFEPLIKQFKSMRSKYDKAAKVFGSWQWYHKNKLPQPSKN